MHTVVDWLKRNRAVLLLFFGLFFTYGALNPTTILGSGYEMEDMQAGDSVLAIVEARVAGVPAPAMALCRNGLVPVALNLPFQLLGKLVGSEDLSLSLEPILDTALLVTLLFIWLRKLTSPGLALFLTLAGGFSTMIWPYAYIGLETKQSLFLLLTAYLALEGRPVRSYGQAILFGLCCLFAIGSKANGLMLLPAVAYVGYIQFRVDWRRRLPFVLTILALVGSISFANMIVKSWFWASLGTTTAKQFHSLIADSFFQMVGNCVGLFGSPTKGLLLYAPLLLLSFYAVLVAWQRHRELTVFVLLAVGGLVGGFAINIYYVDESWGPRYLHACVGPMILLIGASRDRFEWRRDVLMVPLAALGLLISFLGTFFFYGTTQAIAQKAGVHNMGELVGDQEFNQVAFHARLFTIWMNAPPNPVMWTPQLHWIWGAPKDVPPPKAVNLTALSSPQAFLLRGWKVPLQGNTEIVWNLLLLQALLGPVLLGAAGYYVLRGDRGSEQLAVRADHPTLPVSASLAPAVDLAKRSD